MFVATFGMATLWLLMHTSSGLPPIQTIFTQHQTAALRELVHEQTRVDVDLRPMLNDHGKLSAQQVGLSFDKLLRQYRLLEAKVTNSQVDTNYAWLELQLEASFEDQRRGRQMRVVFAFHFKQVGQQLVLRRWVLQDIY
ncbi:hypothetical protein [Acanthopleuribacter pedis]|uniref:Uncharacterized protein n=1 Tax=Acanthopleuribacter pedis TaxID=442870 RepID=A0A8J7QQL4_9BACT|nr:hypothetical protein [Acanthopleuribacter pedis]MBO1322733.1 hypothetical protein [Acanthopleuribacter pedis]